MSRAPDRSIASFDSASAMLRGVANLLHGRDLRALGVIPRPLAPLAERVVPLVNLLPTRARETVYSYGSGREAVPPELIDEVRDEAIAQWMVDRYPRRRYPAVVVGSSSGALVHLCAALGIPFLPTTYLVPVRQADVDPDDPEHALRAGLEPARRLLHANPGIDLHHMHDPNQDRLSLRRMTYFRLKRRTLGPAFESFLVDSLAPNATIYVGDCTLRWPVTRVDERHVFQFGALGGIGAEEFHDGSPRVADYLRRHGSSRSRWSPPAPDEQAPEAEWGLTPALLEDVKRFAVSHGHRVRTISFEDPEQLSPAVADLYRWWHRREGRPADRLLVESFVLLDPWWALALGAVPLWLKFGVQSSADTLERHLASSEPYDDIRLTLFSHGTDGVGVAPIERWQSLLRHAGRDGALLGVDPRRYPRDFASFARFGVELRQLGPRLPLPSPLGVGEFEGYARESTDWTRAMDGGG